MILQQNQQIFNASAIDLDKPNSSIGRHEKSDFDDTPWPNAVQLH